MRRILGAADLWVTVFVLTYDGLPSCTVSIVEFRAGKVARDTQYFADSLRRGPRALNGSSQYVEMFAMKLKPPKTGTDRVDSVDGFYKNLSIMGGFLLLHIAGAEQYSIDALCGIAAP